MMGNVSCVVFSADYSFQNHRFRNILTGISSECQTVWIKIRPVILSGIIWIKPLQRLSAEDNGKQVVSVRGVFRKL